jgi:hypothetical protein
MLEPAHSNTVQATAIGPIACRALEARIPGRVGAVFERSFYVRFGDLWLCAGRGLGLGPLNIVCDGWNVAAPSKLVHPGEVTGGGVLEFGHLCIRTAGAEYWSPHWRGGTEPALLQRGLSALDAVLPPVPGEGLAGLVRLHPKDNFLIRSALPPARYLSALVAASATESVLAIEPKRIAPLLGLGPGLTPSGDDYLSGALVALHMTGHGATARQLWSAIAPLAAARTNDISIAHMSAAAEGYGSAALHAFIDDVVAGGSAATFERTAGLVANGHTSGWDALAGAVRTLRAVRPAAFAPAGTFKQSGPQELAPAADA